MKNMKKTTNKTAKSTETPQAAPMKGMTPLGVKPGTHFAGPPSLKTEIESNQAKVLTAPKSGQKEPETRTTANANPKASPSATNKAPELPKVKSGDLIVNASSLANAIRQVAKITSSASSHIPILTHARLTVNGEKITLRGTNLDSFMEVNLKAIQGKATVDCCVDVARLIKAVAQSQIPYLKEKLVVLGSDNKTVWFGAKREITLNTMLASEFPEVPTMDGKTRLAGGTFTEPGKFAKALTSATSTDEQRYVLNGVYVSPETLVATDGKRLHMVGSTNCAAKLVMDIKTEAGKDAPGIIVPTDTMDLIGGFGNTVEFEVFGHKDEAAKDLNALIGAVHIRVKNRITASDQESSITLLAKLVDGTFPNYRQVIPKPSDIKQTHEVNAEAVLSHLRKTAVVEGGGVFQVKLAIEKNRMTISANSDVGKAEHLELPIKDGKAMEMGMNAAFLEDAVAGAQTDHVRLGFVDGLSPLTVAGTDGWARNIVMPVRLA